MFFDLQSSFDGPNTVLVKTDPTSANPVVTSIHRNLSDSFAYDNQIRIEYNHTIYWLGWLRFAGKRADRMLKVSRRSQDDD